MVFHFLSRSSSPATNFMNGWRNCKSLPANRPWKLMIQENPAKSHHIQLSSAPDPYSFSYATHSRFFSARSLKESGSALLHRETITTGDGKGKKSAPSVRLLSEGVLGLFSLLGIFCINVIPGYHERMKPVFFEELSKLLEAGDVDHILVTASLAIVYVKKSGPKLSSPLAFVLYEPSESRCMIEIESPESFTEKLERTQEALGIPRPDYVPVTYVDAKNE